MDNITKQNQQKWDTLALLEVPCSRPYEHLTPENAKTRLDPYNLIDDFQGKKVLCLASGGGQQSIGFALMGAYVTVVDFSKEQLKKDQEEAEKRSLFVRIVQSDMRDLSAFESGEFDLVYQPYSINYVPDVEPVFEEVDRVLRPDGLYYLMFHNPFVHGTWKDACWGSVWEASELWHGKGYPISQPYTEGLPIQVSDPTWNFENLKGEAVQSDAPQEYKHTLSTIINSLSKKNFSLLKFDEMVGSDSDANPGTWDHYISVAPPWFFTWFRKERKFT